ncbi:MAG: M16 family metallopeptidase [Candidatus Bruticola sp.]
MASLRNRKIWRISFICALLIFIASIIQSSEAQSKQNYYSEVLPNGMLLVLSENLSSPVCSLNIFCKVGGFEENADTMGISHFFEHLFFRGTPTLNGYQFKRAIEALGGQTNASTGRDFTHYYITLPGKNAIKGMRLLADALKNAELDQEAIDQERKAVLEEYRMNLESPARIMNQMMSELAYGEHPYGRPIIGSEYTIKSFNRPDFIKFRDTFISPERTSIVVVGDFKSSEMLAVLREEFSKFTRPQKRIISSYADIKRPSEEVSAVRDIKAQSSFVAVGFVGPSIHDKPDIYQVDVMSFLMGLGRGSLVQKKLVSQGKLQDGGVQFLTQRFPGLISLYGISKVGHEDDVKKDLLSVAAMVRQGQFSDRDLRRAKAFLRSNYSFSEETNAGRADNLGFYASIDDIKFTDRYLSEIEKVSKEDVMAAAAKYLSGGYYCVKLIGQVSEKNKQRSRSGEEAGTGQDNAAENTVKN